MNKKIIIFGTEDLSLLVNFYLSKDSAHEPVAFCVNSNFIKESSLEGIPIVALEDVEKSFPPSNFDFFVSVYDNKLREDKSKEIKNKGYKLASYVSSKATVFSEIGENCLIMENNVIQPFVKIGNNIVMWSGNHIGHHCTLENNIFLSSHVVVSGHVHIKPYCWFGVNSSIRDHVIVEEGTFVAMSSMITKNTKPYKKYTGSPAKEYGDVIF